MIPKNQFIDPVRIPLLDVLACQHTASLNAPIHMMEITRLIRLIQAIGTHLQRMTMIHLKTKERRVDVLNAETCIFRRSWIIWIICGQFLTVISVRIKHTVSHVSQEIIIKTLDAINVQKLIMCISKYTIKKCHWKRNSYSKKQYRPNCCSNSTEPPTVWWVFIACSGKRSHSSSVHMELQRWLHLNIQHFIVCQQSWQH